MSLLSLQRDVRAWLHRGTDECAERFPASARPGLGIYQNNYRAQLAACLEEAFSATRAWIGNEAFHQAVVEHVVRIPPSHWTLDAYPAHFPETLDRRFPHEPDVRELSTIELLLSEAFVAPDAAPVTAAALAGVADWDRAVLSLTPSLSLRPLTTNAPAIWSALANGETPPAARMLPHLGALIVWRQDDRSCMRAIESDEAEALRQAGQGATFADLCAALTEKSGETEAAQLAGRWLGQWLADGLIIAIEESLTCVD